VRTNVAKYIALQEAKNCDLMVTNISYDED